MATLASIAAITYCYSHVEGLPPCVLRPQRSCAVAVAPLDSGYSAGSSLRLVDVAVTVAVVVALTVVVGLVVQFPWESQVEFIVEHLEIPHRLPLVKERFEPVIVVPRVAGFLVVAFFLVLFAVEPVFWMSVAFLVVLVPLKLVNIFIKI